MKLTPYPHQIAGADHLVADKIRALFDDPRVGKNLATVMACDRLGLKKILFITTVSGRAVGRQAFADNQTIARKLQILKPGERITGDVVFVSWAGINNATIRTMILREMWEVVVVDESHYAKSFSAKRTRALYGHPHNDGAHLDQKLAIVVRAQRCWLLSGTPVPHDLSDLYPCLRALAPELLLAHNGLPDVTTITRFEDRYTVKKLFKPTPWVTRWIKVGGKNELELKQRISSNRFMLRRTQAQIGILPARYSLRPIESDEFDPVIEAGMDRDEIIAILESRRNDDNLARLLHLHGDIKAVAAVDAAIEELDNGLDKIVLGYWHRSVGEILAAGLANYGVVGINGQTPPHSRDQIVREFSAPAGSGAPKRVFLQQIAAAGESIDLSASGMLWFVESTFSPAAMKQAAERVTNVRNTRSPIVETLFISGSIDEIVQGRLMSLWAAINRVIR